MMPDLMIVELRTPLKWLVYEPSKSEVKARWDDLCCVQGEYRGDAYSLYTRLGYVLSDDAIQSVLDGYWNARVLGKYEATYITILRGGDYLKV